MLFPTPQGHLDIELNDVGRKQAAAVAHRLSKGPKISVVYSSDLKRAFDIVETIASNCGGLQVARRLSKGPKISVVYSFDLKRALDTVETIASSCDGLQVVKDLDLRERRLGDLHGLVYHEASKISPKAYVALSSHRANQQIPVSSHFLFKLRN
ncbi:phosphoglycerate mutase-like protein 4 isoform X2 [Rhododendron vialii]|uniref:phosphoglycerate mutase-like protein 4 isoform X2 n=1 Tax=Rhododendron vialii TaxID=182163 RepID=UPI00265F4976|nr:phosphoglycerate mutase-like protein 4 isoform X2 [Rhododendron vialii]